MSDGWLCATGAGPARFLGKHLAWIACGVSIWFPLSSPSCFLWCLPWLEKQHSRLSGYRLCQYPAKRPFRDPRPHPKLFARHAHQEVPVRGICPFLAAARGDDGDPAGGPYAPPLRGECPAAQQGGFLLKTDVILPTHC